MGTLSSRNTSEPTTLTEDLQEMVDVMYQFLEVDEKPADDQDELVAQLQAGIGGLIDDVETSDVQIALMATDILQLSLDNAGLARAVTEAAVVLEALAEPPSHEETIELAMGVLRREGQAKIDIVPTDEEMVLRTNLTFDEDVLREALAVAIHEYVNQLSEGILAGRIKRR